MRRRLVWVSGMMALLLLFGVVGIVSAQSEEPTGDPARRRPARAYGVIQQVDGPTLALATPVGQVAVILDDNTVFRVPGVEKPGVGDLTVGDYVGLAGWWGDANVFHAFVVARVASDRIFPLTGEFVGAADGALTLDTPWGPATVSVTDDTEYRIPRVDESGLSDLKAGMRTVARGTLGPDGALTAHVVAVLTAPPAARWAAGNVSAIGDRGFVLRTSRRRVLVTVGDGTRFRVPGVDDPSIADIAKGDTVAVRGVARRPGVARARFVAVLPEGVARLAGEVDAIGESSLALSTAGGPVDVVTDAETSVRVPGVDEATLDFIVPGDHIVATGVWAGEAAFSAMDGGVRRPRQEGTRGLVRGRAITVEAEHLVVGATRGPITVRVDEGTRFAIPEVDEPGLADVSPGDAVVVWGTWSGDGTLSAAHLRVLGAR